MQAISLFVITAAVVAVNEGPLWVNNRPSIDDTRSDAAPTKSVFRAAVKAIDDDVSSLASVAGSVESDTVMQSYLRETVPEATQRDLDFGSPSEPLRADFDASKGTAAFVDQAEGGSKLKWVVQLALDNAVASGSASVVVLGASHSRCLEVPRGMAWGGMLPFSAPCAETPAQEWQWINSLYLYNPMTNMCLDRDNNQKDAGTKVQLWQCNLSGAQAWQVKGKNLVLPGSSSLCLAVDSVSAVLKPCNSDDDTVIDTSNVTTSPTSAPSPVSPGTITIGWNQTDCLQGAASGVEDGTKPSREKCNGNIPAQQWQWLKSIYLYNPSSAKCLDRNNSQMASGTNVQLSACNWGDSQTWQAKTNALNSTTLVHPSYPTLCLSVPSDSSDVKLNNCQLGDNGEVIDVSQLFPSPLAGAIAIGKSQQYCLEAPAGAIRNGIVPFGAKCTGALAQQWQWINSNFLYNALTKMCLDRNQNQVSANTTVQLWTCNWSDAQTWNITGPRLVARNMPSMAISVGLGSGATLQPYIWNAPVQIVDMSKVISSTARPTFSTSVLTLQGQLYIGASRNYCVESRGYESYVAICDASKPEQIYTWSRDKQVLTSSAFSFASDFRRGSFISQDDRTQCLAFTSSLGIGQAAATKKTCDPLDDTQFYTFATSPITAYTQSLVIFKGQLFVGNKRIFCLETQGWYARVAKCDGTKPEQVYMWRSDTKILTSSDYYNFPGDFQGGAFILKEDASQCMALPMNTLGSLAWRKKCNPLDETQFFSFSTAPTTGPTISTPSFKGQLFVGVNRTFCLEANGTFSFVANCDATKPAQIYKWDPDTQSLDSNQFTVPCDFDGTTFLFPNGANQCVAVPSLSLGSLAWLKTCNPSDDTQVYSFAAVPTTIFKGQLFVGNKRIFCLETQGWYARVAKCDGTKPEQVYMWRSDTKILTSSDYYNFPGDFQGGAFILKEDASQCMALPMNTLGSLAWRKKCNPLDETQLFAFATTPTTGPTISTPSFKGQLFVGVNRTFCLEANGTFSFVANCDATKPAQIYKWDPDTQSLDSNQFTVPCDFDGTTFLFPNGANQCVAVPSLSLGSLAWLKTCNRLDDTQYFSFTTVPTTTYKGQLFVGAKRNFCLESNGTYALVANCDEAKRQQVFTWRSDSKLLVSNTFTFPSNFNGGAFVLSTDASQCLTFSYLAIGQMAWTRLCDPSDDTQAYSFATTPVTLTIPVLRISSQLFVGSSRSYCLESSGNSAYVATCNANKSAQLFTFRNDTKVLSSNQFTFACDFQNGVFVYMKDPSQCLTLSKLSLGLIAWVKKCDALDDTQKYAFATAATWMGTIAIGSDRISCLEAASGADPTDIRPRRANCNGLPAQQWQWVNSLYLYNPSSNMCIERTSNRAGSALQLMACYAGSSQTWQVQTNTAKNTVLVHPDLPTVCLAVDATFGTVETCQLGREGEILDLSQVNAAIPLNITGTIAVGASRLYCLEAPIDDVYDGIQPVGAMCTGTSAQQWLWINSLLLYHPLTKRCLDRDNNKNTAGTSVQLWTCNWSAAQTWQVNGATLVVPDAPNVVLAAGLGLETNLQTTKPGDDLQVFDVTKLVSAAIPAFSPSASGFQGLLFVGPSRNYCLESRGASSYVATCNASKPEQVYTWRRETKLLTSNGFSFGCDLKGGSIISKQDGFQCMAMTSSSVTLGGVTGTKKCDPLDLTQQFYFDPAATIMAWHFSKQLFIGANRSFCLESNGVYAYVAICDATNPAQVFTFQNDTKLLTSNHFVFPCDLQGGAFVYTYNTSQCLAFANLAVGAFAWTKPCNSLDETQLFYVNPATPVPPKPTPAPATSPGPITIGTGQQFCLEVDWSTHSQDPHGGLPDLFEQPSTGWCNRDVLQQWEWRQSKFLYHTYLNMCLERRNDNDRDKRAQFSRCTWSVDQEWLVNGPNLYQRADPTMCLGVVNATVKEYQYVTMKPCVLGDVTEMFNVSAVPFNP
ncbi:Aste57867_21564 [Aphanomyces stellatus]|uniref:Aste57867_21564 protein n=1 Tax=Aphanomyces stellatus TaxID=120398 RepID=A0A485LHV8_9STRA|nr:hypothetical protein As57867_021495 [Aphanomyces stellatus]VFT98234.1 Aste57867_21564 [Aphanomyces stellatus]